MKADDLSFCLVANKVNKKNIWNANYHQIKKNEVTIKQFSGSN